MADERQEGRVRFEGIDLGDSKLGRWARSLPAELGSRLQAIFRRRRVSAGQVLAEEGKEPAEITYVLDGTLGMVKELPDGRKHIIGLLSRSDMFGHLFDETPAYRIEALSDGEVLTCPRRDFEALLSQSPPAEQALLIDISDELDAALEWVMVLGGPKVVQRVAAFLLALARRQLRAGAEIRSSAEPLRLWLGIRRGDLAQYLGSRQESLSRAFRELERDGILRAHSLHDIEILNLPGLVEVAGLDLPAEG